MTPMYMKKRNGEKSMRPQYYTKNSRHLKKTGKKEKWPFPEKRTPIGSTNWPVIIPHTTHMVISFGTEQAMLGIYVHINAYMLCMQ